MDTYETTIYNAVLITAVSFAFIILFFILSIFRSHRRANEERRKQYLNDADLLERERTRIASDLHDELSPLLTVSRIYLSIIRVPGTKENELIKDAALNIDLLSKRLGEIARNLTPGILPKKGLGEALNQLTDRYRYTGSFEIEFRCEVASNIDQKTAIHIYRMIQELLHNSLKHANPKMVSIRVKERKGTLYILYKDNGRGFNIEEALEEGKGMGVQSLKSRTEMMGGSIEMASGKDKGTEYFIQIPI